MRSGSQAATVAALIGTVQGGIAAGYLGGFIGGVVRRLIDIQTAFPFLIIALTIVAVFGASVPTLIITLAFWTWVPFARLAQARALRSFARCLTCPQLVASAPGERGSSLATFSRT